MDAVGLSATGNKKLGVGGGRRSYQAATELASTESDPMSHAYMPIKALNQFSTDWVIKARIVKKGNMRTWKNDRGEGTIMNIDLIDREGTLIQATGFNETANRLQEQLDQDQVYTFSGG